MASNPAPCAEGSKRKGTSNTCIRVRQDTKSMREAGGIEDDKRHEMKQLQ
jgi:hypothetical protein